ncbi:MAG: hypothetical protein A2Z99_05165 [Treponema sp. GWB1_62_6]|nr:MAG: hypothetical protein A2Z99_05165 [Treponema sp. GWB1_62_6]OHE63761.1 MAG: hypothetical protein A2001_00910 [Treponema sp. GWC1_61_84]OHE68691.1 MAG: hypothetical protein A2413_09350 [Treponema sp. RIFOXYC1_FULL_61_9]HCM27999.1 hypothetical protein [Treponema sp.]
MVVACLVLTFAASFAAAQEAAPAASGGFELGLGTASLPVDPTDPATEYVTYQNLALKPEFAFGKFGLGLDLTVNFNLRLGSTGEGVEFYEPDWNPDAAGKSFIELYLPKIAYIRWAKKGDPLYLKFGSFDDGTLGNGFIMGNYSNTRFLPGTRIFGAAVDVDGALFNFPYVGIETFAGNLARLDVVGTRLFARPLFDMENPILKNLQLGATIAADREPLIYDSDETNDDEGSVAVFGIDGRLPILGTPMVSLATFADIAFQPEGRWGTMIGLGGRLASIFTYGAQLRLLAPGFIPTYFDGSYDIFRHAKYAVVSEAPEGSAYAGWLASIGTSLMADVIIFNVTLSGPFGAEDSGKITDYPQLRGIFTIGEGLLGGFSLDAFYEKYYLGADTDQVPLGTGDFFTDLIDPNNAVIGAKINYATGPAVLSLLYNLRYDPSATNNFIVTSSLMSSIRF